MTIPQWVRNRMAEAGDNTDIATGIGIEIAVNFLSRVVDVIDGIYLMPPFKKYDIAVRILSDVQSSQVNRATT
jgi:homocysteine S-methyltransferase